MKGMNGRRLFASNTVISSIKWCCLVFSINQQASENTSIKYWQRSVISLILFTQMTSGSGLIKRITIILISELFNISKSISCIQVEKNIIFIKIKCNFLAMWYSYKLFVRRTKRLRSYMIGLNRTQYKIFRYFWDLLTSTNNLSRAWVW